MQDPGRLGETNTSKRRDFASLLAKNVDFKRLVFANQSYIDAEGRKSM